MDDLFKPQFKFYKRRVPPPDLSSVIDFSNGGCDDHVAVTVVDVAASAYACIAAQQFVEVGLRPPESWEVHGLRQCPGLYFIRNPFLPEGQRSWIRRCLVEYPRTPNRTNIDDMLDSIDCSLWNHHVQHYKDKKRSLLSKLRWVTLGYHHDWDTKVYNLSQPMQLPVELKILSKLVISVLGFDEFSAEAAIVNCYDLSSSLGAHTDHSEVDQTQPLLSISFGQTAVFLLGGPTKERKPQAIYLKSGDMLVMSGESRLAYHAVPRILHTVDKPWIADEDSDNPIDEPDWTLLNEYIAKFRINMNIRQVFSSG